MLAASDSEAELLAWSMAADKALAAMTWGVEATWASSMLSLGVFVGADGGCH